MKNYLVQIIEDDSSVKKLLEIAFREHNLDSLSLLRK